MHCLGRVYVYQPHLEGTGVGSGSIWYRLQEISRDKFF